MNRGAWSTVKVFYRAVNSKIKQSSLSLSDIAGFRMALGCEIIESNLLRVIASTESSLPHLSDIYIAPPAQTAQFITPAAPRTMQVSSCSVSWSTAAPSLGNGQISGWALTNARESYPTKWPSPTTLLHTPWEDGCLWTFPWGLQTHGMMLRCLRTVKLTVAVKGWEEMFKKGKMQFPPL